MLYLREPCSCRHSSNSRQSSRPKQPKIESQQSETHMGRFRTELETELTMNEFASADSLNAALLEASRRFATEHPASAPRVIDGLREEVKHMWQARKDMLAVVPAHMITRIRRYQMEDRTSQDETSISTWVRDDRMRGVLVSLKLPQTSQDLSKTWERKRELSCLVKHLKWPYKLKWRQAVAVYGHSQTCAESS